MLFDNWSSIACSVTVAPRLLLITKKRFFTLCEWLILHLSTLPNLPSSQRTFDPGPTPSAIHPDLKL